MGIDETKSITGQSASTGPRPLPDVGTPEAWCTAWAPELGQLVPVALPKRFVDGVAWDEV